MTSYSNLLISLAITSLSLIQVLFWEPTAVPVDPPRCEVYDVNISTAVNQSMVGKILTTTDAYGGHAPGALTEDTFLAHYGEGGAYGDTLNLYAGVYAIDLPKGFNFVMLPSDGVQTVEVDAIEALTFEEGYGCGQDSSYTYIFPQSIYELPLASIEAVRADAFKHVYDGVDVRCWFALKDEEATAAYLEKAMGEITASPNWYKVHRTNNDRLWQDKGLALFCHALAW